MTEDAAPKALRILVIVSRPLDLPDLSNLADQWALQRGLCRVQAPAYLKMLRPPTVEGLRAEILNGYDIVHFDGHGDFGLRCKNCGGLNLPEQKECSRCEALLEDQAASGYFAFEREDGLLDALAAEELAEIVTSLPENAPKLVFLSACHSARGGGASLQSALLDNGVPSVLGMNDSVPLKATMALAGPFYAGLGAGMTIDRAFKNALPALKGLENGGKLQEIPVLDGPGKEARILTARATGKASFDPELLFGLPDFDLVGDYIRADPPRGRKGLLSQAMNDLQSGEKLVALTGQGGIGKTVLAAEAACRLAWHYPGGVFWRSAADIKDLDLDKLLNAFDNVFGPQLRSLSLDQKRDTVLNYLRNYDTSSLLVVDNAESIKDEALWRFLEGIPQPSAALVTTRESLPREGKEIRIPEMEPVEATRLLWMEARRRKSRWGEHLSPEDMESLKEIAGVMNGHPLAIKLTAALLARRSLSGIRDELRKNPPKEVSERFDVSFNSLTEGQRDLFCRLAIFSSSMTEEAVGSICVEDADSDWKGDLGELERRSFLDRIEIAVQDESGSETSIYRYKLHPLMRQYAAGKAGEELLARLRPRAADYFLDYASDNSDNFRMLGMEHENLLESMDWFVGQQKSSSFEALPTSSYRFLQFLAELGSYLGKKGYWTEYNRRLQQAVAVAEALEDQSEMAGLIYKLAILAKARGERDAARNFCKQSLRIYKELGFKWGISGSLSLFGTLAQSTGYYKAARNLYQKSLKINEELKNKGAMAGDLRHLGALAKDCGDYKEARRLCQQSLKIYQELDDKEGISRSLFLQGTLVQDSGDYNTARDLYQQCLKIEEELEDKSGISAVLHQIGNIEFATGECNAAIKHYKQSLEIEQELGHKKGMSASLGQLGMIAQTMGDSNVARERYQECMEIEQKLGDKSAEAISLHHLGTLAQDTGDYHTAHDLYQKSLEISQKLGNQNTVAASLYKLGEMALDSCDYDVARDLFQKCMEIAQNTGKKSDVVESLHKLGILGHLTGEYDAARDLYQKSMEIAQEMGDKGGVVRSLYQLGMLAHDTGEYDAAREFYQKSLKIARKMGDKSNVAASLHKLGLLAQATGNYVEARKFYQKSMKIVQDLGDKMGLFTTLNQLGLLANETGEYDAAREFYQMSLEIAQEMGDKSNVAASLHNLSLLSQATGDYVEARKFCQKSMKIVQELKDKWGLFNSLYQMGMLARETGEYDAAHGFYQKSMKIAQELKNKRGLFNSLYQMGMLAHETGEYVEARKLYQKSMKIAQELGYNNGMADLAHQMGWLAQTTGDYDTARKHYLKSMKIAQELGDMSGMARSLHHQGMLAYIKEDYDAARNLYQQSLEITQELDDENGMALSQAQLALLEEKMGNIRAALHLIRQAEFTFRELGSPYAKLAEEVRQRLEQNQL